MIGWGEPRQPKPTKLEIVLRPVEPEDIAVFFEHATDPVAAGMAAFTDASSQDRARFEAKWKGILEDESTVARTIEVEGSVAGHVASFVRSGEREVTYWIGRSLWGRGIATQALSTFLRQETTRPLFARVAEDNSASVRVLEKCGFEPWRHDEAWADARSERITEVIYRLEGRRRGPA